MTSPSAAWYEPPEPVLCCALAEDDPDHDPEACLADQAEAAAEAKAERLREDYVLSRRWLGDERIPDVAQERLDDLERDRWREQGVQDLA